MPLTLPYPNTPNDGDAFLSLPVRSNINAITQAIQSFDGSQVQAGSIASAAIAAAANPVTRGAETIANFVASGCVWSVGAGLTANMTSGVVYVNGVRVSVISVSGKAFTASQDTYVDIDNLGNVYYLPVANGGASPALTGNSVRVAKVISNGTNVTSAVQSGVDSLFNPIDPISPVKLVSNIFGQSVQSYTNTGAGGGTGYYINLGGIKLCWGNQVNNSISNIATGTSTNQNVSFPVGFFTTVTYANIWISAVLQGANQYVSGNGVGTNGIGFYITNNSAGVVGAGISWLAIGT